MPDYSVTAAFRVSTDADRARVQALLEQGLKELEPIAARYGVTIRDSSVLVGD